jgi:hypothetical protein
VALMRVVLKRLEEGSESPPSGRSRLFRSYTVSMLSGESHRGVSGPHEGCPQASGGGL